MGYDTMPDKELKQRARWDIYLLVLRALAMFIMAAHGLYFVLVPLMALVLSYLEIWPGRALGAQARSVSNLRGVAGGPGRAIFILPLGHRRFSVKGSYSSFIEDEDG